MINQYFWVCIRPQIPPKTVLTNTVRKQKVTYRDHLDVWICAHSDAIMRIILPGPTHLDIFTSLLAAPMGPNLVTDAHLAALAIEHQAELHSNDTDFARFSGLTWRNPVA